MATLQWDAKQGVHVKSKVARQMDRLTVPQQEGGKVCLRVVLVKVRSRNANKAVETYPLLDSGSDIIPYATRL